MVNSSLQTGHFADEWRNAHVLPKLKKRGLSILYFLTRAVSSQMNSYMTINNLYPLDQSSYRIYHSTETALLKVMNDILLGMNSQQVTLLLLLVLSAAFDTIDHSLLLERLHKKFGISGTALDWLTSYLSDRSQHISINGTLSDRFQLKCGVPQGSCYLSYILASTLILLSLISLKFVAMQMTPRCMYLSNQTLLSIRRLH